ncbi:hypothetical protein DNTS_029917 [Danionella cerebrum]|uniref:Uncharacterized protein n=1 Tax=Danionella cerebrum TaxID=2873325 RepID=A0A553RPW0_9TELE|nr:hypothetical protein DNTS_029917 [Danionella translucida]
MCNETASDCAKSSESNELEKDEKVNFLSVGIYWLRILFLKTVAFNVTVTFNKEDKKEEHQ